jgi:hypothetical protein
MNKMTVSRSFGPRIVDGSNEVRSVMLSKVDLAVLLIIRQP